MAARILLIEDDEALLALLDYNLAAAGYGVTAAASAEDGEQLLLGSQFDLAIVDWMLPDMHGIELVARLRRSQRHAALPILMLTARGEEEDRVRGLSTGADDYVVKPFSVPEVLARVKALLRRASPERIEDVLSVGDIVLDRSAHRVCRGAREVTLGPTEYKLLETMMESPTRVLSRGQLLDRVWGNTAEIDQRTIDVHIGRLRKALMQDGEPDPIRTVRGTGYALGVVPV